MGVVTAYILCKMQVGTDEQVFSELKKLKEIQEANATYGAYDLLVKVNFKTIENLDKFVFEKIRAIKGIIETSSMIVAMRVIE